MYINLEELARMEKASYLLPDPGGEVARSLITEARRFRLFGVRILNETSDPHVKHLIHLALYDSPYIKDFSETNTPSSLEETNGSQTY